MAPGVFHLLLTHSVIIAFEAMLFGDLGTLGVRPFLSISGLPAILTEWSALLPLVSHLANHDDDHRIIGKLALEGRLTVGLFPKLGYLDGLRRLLQYGPAFLDRANADSASTYKVWDVNWGSTFNRANGSAISLITEYALRNQRQAIDLPEDVVTPSGSPGIASPSATTTTANNAPHSHTGLKTPFRRHQELHIVRMGRLKGKRTMRGKMILILLSLTGEVAYHITLVALIIMLCLIGAFGSAAILVNGLISKSMCRILCVKRPPGYLESNENHEACMLSAVHENAQTWYLYIGDRGVIDWMLNKTMLVMPSASPLQTYYFRIAHILQLLAMTFVAAQKGSDGISLIIVLTLNYAYHSLFNGHRLARQWLEAEEVSVDVHTFRFSGRTPMLGVVHSLSQARDATWMGAFITSCPRLGVWLEELKRPVDMRGKLDLSQQGLSPLDRSWVTLNTQLTVQAEILIRKVLHRGNSIVDQR